MMSSLSTLKLGTLTWPNDTRTAPVKPEP